MSSADRLIQLTLVISAAVLVGMVTGSWQLILYPGLISIGVFLALGFEHRTARFRFVLPVSITGILLVLYGALDLMGVSSPTGAGTVLGFDPMTAFYFFVIGPVFTLTGLLYALTDAKDAA